MVLKLKRLNNFLRVFFSEEKKIFVFFIAAFFSTFLVFNNKLYVLLFFVLSLFLFFIIKKNFWNSVFLTFLISIPFENTIREWFYQVTPPLFDNILTSGYYFYFGLSVKLIFAIFLFLMSIFRINKKKTFDFDFGIISLMVFLLISVINTLLTNNTISILGLARIWLGVWIFILSKTYFNKKKSVFFVFIMSLYIFSITFGAFQLIRQKPLGTYIELTPSFSQSGYVTTDGEKQYRVSGFISHPVYFASFLSILFPIYLGYSLKKIKDDNRIFDITIFTLLGLIGCVVIIGTLSRSSFFTLLVTLIIFRKEIWDLIIVRYKKCDIKIKIFAKIFCLIVMIILVYFLTPRIESFGSLFEKNGNGSIRLELIKQSIKMISKNPFGVGLNNFTKELVTYNLPKSLNGFIVPVHNTFLIFFTELGILGGGFFVLFIIYTFLKDFNKKKKDLADFGVWVGILAFLINSQIHPLFNLDPTFDLLMLVLGYYSICLYQKK